MDWDSYYEKFYEWATSTQIKKMSSLTSFGASAEVAEVAQEYMVRLKLLRNLFLELATHRMIMDSVFIALKV